MDETLHDGETIQMKVNRRQATDNVIRLFRLRLYWSKLGSNLRKLKNERQVKLKRDKRDNDRKLLLRQLNEQLEQSEILDRSANNPPDNQCMGDRSRLDDSVLESLSELLRRNDVSQDQNQSCSLDKTDLTIN